MILENYKSSRRFMEFVLDFHQKELKKEKGGRELAALFAFN
jgi:hypothetical protein